MGSKADLVVIGSGGAAFAAAIRATGMGKSVVMIEKGTIGGTCVNTGCVPSKALLAAADARHTAADLSRFPGLTGSTTPVDMRALVDGKQTLVDSLRTEKYIDVAASYGWRVVTGTASFSGTPQDPTVTIVDSEGQVETIEAEQYLIATGSTPWIPAIEGLDTVDYLTSTTAMELATLPEALLIVGGGYVALEQAQLFARLGVKVTMLVRSRLASSEEPEASIALGEVFADEGIHVIDHATVTRIHTGDDGRVTATVAANDTTEEHQGDRILVATGRRPVTDNLGLDTVQVKTSETGAVIVTDQLQTSNRRIWAAGDATGHHEFVYVAAHHGAMVVDNAFAAAGRTVDYSHVPRVTFTSPALARVGATEKDLLAAGLRCDCRVLPLQYVPRAIVNRDTRGFIKIVVDADTGRIHGLTAVAKDAGEIAAAGVYLLNAGMTITDVANTWAPYLTMAEGIKIAAQSFTTDVSQLSCCAV
ncbi:MAG TPA: mercury(II) reductase [Nocardioides sp.]